MKIRNPLHSRKNSETNGRRTGYGPALLAVAGVTASLAVFQSVPASGAGSPEAQAENSTARSGGGHHRTQLVEELEPMERFNGRWRCLVTNTIESEPSTHTAILNIRPILNGEWQEWTGTELPSDTFPTTRIGKWIYGWHDAQGEFTSYLYDDQGNRGDQTSPGWVDGHLIFTGPAVFLGQPLVGKDDFTFQDDDHWTDVYTVQIDGQWIPMGTTECARI